MFSAKGRTTVHLFPQFQAERIIEKKSPQVSYKIEKTAHRMHPNQKEDFFFYNILDYNKEAEAKLRKTSYITPVWIV